MNKQISAHSKVTYEYTTSCGIKFPLKFERGETIPVTTTFQRKDGKVVSAVCSRLIARG